MRDSRSHYLNVFFAYRGVPQSDVTLTKGGQLEDNLTRALGITLDHASRSTLTSFLDMICHASIPASAVTDTLVLLQPLESPEAPLRRLVGLSPVGALNRRDFEEGAGGSRPDLLIVIPGKAVIVIESKAVSGTNGEQLWRHARAHGLPLPVRRAGKLQIPDEWVQQSWRHLARWAEEASDPDPIAAFLLCEFAEYLHISGVTGRTVSKPSPRVVELDSAHDDFLTALAQASDLDEVTSVCKRLYGDPASPFYVYGDVEQGHTYTSQDSARVRRVYQEAGEPIPPRLTHNGGNVITARRALSIAYGSKVRYLQSFAHGRTQETVSKFAGVGADRAVLLGLLAWAWPRSDQRAGYLRAVIAKAWSGAPIHSLSTPELHDELPPSALAALEAEH